MSVWVIKTQAQRAFTETSTAFDAVLGARGSKLQLVLNAIFHLEGSPGNMAWADYEQIKRHPAVKAAIPIAVGDNFRGWRIAGTVAELFSTVEYAPGKHYTFASGGLFQNEAKEAVVGSFAAAKLGWKIGTEFQPYHGLVFNPNNQHEDHYKVSGILAPTNTPADRVIWIPIHGVQTMAGHDPRTASDISAVLIQLRAPAAGMMLDQLYNRQGNRLTFAFPASAIIADLFSKIGWFDQVLGLVAYLVALVAAGSILASIYASMNARRRDIAILRSLGAHRRLVFGSVVAEAATIGALGSVLGFAVYFVLVTGVAQLIRTQTGVVLSVASGHAVLWICPLAMIALSALGGVVPAIKAYRISVAETLVPLS